MTQCTLLKFMGTMLFTLISDVVKIECLLVLKPTNKQQSGNSSSKFVFSLGYKALNTPRCNMHIVAVLFTEQCEALGSTKNYIHFFLKLKRQKRSTTEISPPDINILYFLKLSLPPCVCQSAKRITLLTMESFPFCAKRNSMTQSKRLIP